MDKNYKLFLTLGIIIIIIPFLGFPEPVKTILLFIVGVILVVISLMYRSNAMLNGDSDEVEETIYIDSDGHVSKKVSESEDDDDDDEVKEIDIEINEGEQIELKIVSDDDEKDKD